MATYNVLEYGAVGDGQANDAAAIQRAVDACHSAGGGMVLAPAGKVFRSGTIALKSNVELHVERGAVIVGSSDYADYDSRLQVGALSAGTINGDQPGYGMLITADRADNIAITGNGVIDGNGRSFVVERGQYIYKMTQNRPFTIFLVGCHNVTFRDITLRDGALWTLRLSGCQDVTIHAVHIDNDLRLPNNDGIDLDHCRDVRISDCNIVSGDDCIVLKTCEETNAFGPCENIIVTGCTLVSTSSALIVGAEARSVMRDVIFDSCTIRSSHRGLAIHLSESSDVENILFSNMIVETRIFDEKWWGRGEPIYITAIPWTEDRGIGQVRNVRFMNVLARSENGVYVEGWEQGNIENVLFENVRVELNKWSRWPGGRADVRPCPGEGLPEQTTSGFFLKNARNITLRNCEVAWGENRPPYFCHALESINVDNLELENFKGKAAHPDQYADIVKDGTPS